MRDSSFIDGRTHGIPVPICSKLKGPRAIIRELAPVDEEKEVTALWQDSFPAVLHSPCQRLLFFRSVSRRLPLLVPILLLLGPGPWSGLDAQPGLTGQPLLSPQALLREGDARYQRRDYSEARLFYLLGFRERPDSDSAARLLINHLRLDPRGTMDGDSVRQALALRQEGSFAYHYIALFASYRLGWPEMARFHEQALEQKSRTQLKEGERYWFQILQGTRLIQETRWEEAEMRFSELASTPGETGALASRIKKALDARKGQTRKSPWMAAGLSALLPGAGQFYARHYSDGVMAFFWNATFLGGGAYAYRLEQQAGRPHAGSVLAGIVGLLFYATNIAGAHVAANQYNIHQDRAFYQEIRDTYFNVETIERTSNLEFTRPLQFE